MLQRLPPLFVVSGGHGTSGELVVRTALAQFEGIGPPVTVVPHVRSVAQIETVVTQAADVQGTIVHTLVDATLRYHLIRLAREKNVVAIDLMGHLLARLTTLLGREPVGQPGLYRQLREDYFDRVEAVDFAVRHDDGQNPRDWPLAEIVLIGVSRVGKTPLSMYLSIQGWKVANVPLVREVPLPPALFELDPRRVVGVSIQPEYLLSHRRWRQRQAQMTLGTAYDDPQDVRDEMAAARRVFSRGGFAVVDMTHKSIEDGANEVISLVTHSLAEQV